MRMIRTLIWIVLTAVLVAFVAMNWTKAPVNIWPLDDGEFFHFEWPVGFTALVFFLLGLAPMWLIHRAGRWRLKRRIAALEAVVQRPSAALTSTQLDAAAPEAETQAP